MSKKVHELAKELDIPTKQVLEITGMEMEGSGAHLKTLTAEQEAIVKEKVREIQNNAGLTGAPDRAVGGKTVRFWSPIRNCRLATDGGSDIVVEDWVVTAKKGSELEKQLRAASVQSPDILKTVVDKPFEKEELRTGMSKKMGDLVFTGIHREVSSDGLKCVAKLFSEKEITELDLAADAYVRAGQLVSAAARTKSFENGV